jgi:RHS repeat-associated protein
MNAPRRIVWAIAAGRMLAAGLLAADPVPQPQVLLAPEGPGSWNLQWQGVEQRTYFVQYSRDLVTWTYSPVIRHGPGPQEYEMAAAAAAGLYVRLKYPNEDRMGSLEEARNADFDGDGIPNWREIEELDADPFDVMSVGPDGDGDGMPDAWELARGLDPADPADAAGDPDHDDLSNLGEFRAQTNPAYFDSDGDRFSDGFEAGRAGYDPLVANADGDADGDGLTDRDEVANGTDPAAADSDGDGVSDAVELGQGSDPLDPVRRPFNPAAHFGAAVIDALVQPMGNLGVNYSPGPQYKISVSLRDDLRWFGPPPGKYFSEQESWRLAIGSDRGIETNPAVIPFGGGWYAPYQTIGAEMQLDGSKNHRLTLQHLGVAGPASPGVQDSPEADYRHSLYVACPGFLVLTNNPAIPPRNFISQSSGAVGYDWTTRENHLIPLASTGYASSYSGGDATGPRFRRISHFGRPLPEFTPEQEGEGDQSGEESQVDAFDLSLRHDTSFASIPLAASELRLEAAASTRETQWSNRGGLRPAEDLTAPFGISWASNLCAYIEVVETFGHNTTRPATVNVVDEGGRGQRFGSADGLATFFAWPSGVVDKKSSLNELKREGFALVLRKKFGNTLTYRQCSSWFLYSSDRLEAGDSVRRHSYWRLEEVRDRLGQKVVYDYGSSAYSLIPEEIRAQGRPGQRLRITRSANGRRVTSIEDALGNVTAFHYLDGTAAVAGTNFEYPYQQLARVTFPGGAEEHYAYEVVTDPETLNGKTTHHFHANLASIRRGNGALRVFHYEFDRSRKWWDSSFGRIAIRASLDGVPDDIRQRARDYVAAVNRQPQAGSVLRVQHGVPRRIARIEWPTLNLHSTFAKTAETRTVFGPSFEGVSATEVTDTAGKRYRYDFTGVQGEIIDTDTTLVGGTSSVSTDWLIRYTLMTLRYLGGAGSVLGAEEFDFDPAASLGLKRMVDFSGNETVWEFAESRPPGPRLAPRNDPEFLSKWPDPTLRMDALGRVERYEYGPLRILSKSTDVHGTVTEFGVDALGRRTSMVAKDAAGDRLLEERYVYGNAAFPGFMTRKTRVAFADWTGKDWERDLVTEYHADAFGRLAREVVDPGGLSLETLHSYDLNGRKSGSRDPNGNLTSFEYDGMNRLVRVTHADGSIRQTDYDANNLKVREVDENGHVTLWQRDALGRVTATVRDLDGDGVASAGDPTTRVAYDAAGSVRKVVDPRGFATVTFHDDLHRPSNVFQGVPAAAADGDLEALKTLAAGSRAITRTELRYEAESNSGGGLLSAFQPTRTIRHDVLAAVPGEPDATLTGTAVFNALYRQVGESVEYLPGASRASTVEFGAIDDDGQEALVTISTDALGKATRTTRDGMGRELEVVDGFGLADPEQVLTRSMAYSSTGFAWQVTDPLGRQSETEYDAAGRPVKVWQPDPVSGLVSADSPVTGTVYDGNGNAVAVIDPLGRRSDFDFDSRNRQWRTRTPAVTDAADPDAPVAGVRPVSTVQFDAVGNAIAVTDPRGSMIRTFFDRANRPVLTRSNPVTGLPSSDLGAPAAGDITSTTVLDPGGLSLALIDGNGNITRNAYDGLGRLVATVCDPADGDPVDPAAAGFDAAAYRASAPGGLLVTSRHDDAGNVIELTDGKGQRTAFTHDGFQRKTRTVRDPGTAAEEADAMEYNALYQIRRIDEKGRVTLYRHDFRHRLSDIIYQPGPDGSSAHPDNRRLRYDRAGKVLEVSFPNEAGSLRASASTYDLLDRLTSETSAGVTHLYPSYDKAGNRLQVTYGRSGTTLLCAYDALNRLIECEERPAAATPSGRFTRHAYDAGGKVTRKTLPNGSATTSRFDKLGRTLSITETNGGGALVSAFDYTAPVGGWPGSHDAAGNVLRCAERYSRAGMVDRVVVNSYDRCHRLATETVTPAGGPASVTTYGYDLANNRVTRTVDGAVTRYVYGDGSNGANANQLVSYGPDGQPATHSFTYDASGNRATRLSAAGTETYAWDHENRLTGLGVPSGSYRYGYDHRSRRVLRDESLAGGSLTLLSFSGGLSVQEADDAGVVRAEIIRGSDWGGGTGGVLYSIRGGQRSYQGYNARGDVVSASDDSGAATWQGAYQAFGTRSAEQGSSSDRQRANTKDEDPTGLLNEGFRYRDLEAGVFLSRDPAGFVDGPNVYTYVRQNPWTYFDPEGLFMQYFGDWAAATFGAPPAPVCFMAKHSDKVSGTVQVINGAASFVPGIGKLADGLNATILAAEGNYEAAALAASTGKAVELGTKAFKAVGVTVIAVRGISHADEAVSAGRAAANSVDEVVDQAKTARNAMGEAAEDTVSRLETQTTSGVELVGQRGKTSTILGSYRSDMKKIVEEMGNVKSLDFGPKPGGFNVLNVPDKLYKTPAQFWDDFNKPWLDLAISRGDNFIFATKPAWGKGSVLTRPNATSKLELSGFGKEYLHVRKSGFTSKK